MKTSSGIKNKKPKLLFILCLLTLAGSIIAGIICLVALLCWGWIVGKLHDSFHILSIVNINYIRITLICLVVLSASSATGSWLMLKMKKVGFYLYLIPAVIMIFVSVFVVFNVFNIVFFLSNIALLVLYSTQYRWLK